MDTKDRILAAARKVFDRDGVEGLSMRDVAKEVGITPMAIYRHYENKQALIDALVLDGLAEWSKRAEAIPAGTPLLFLARIGEAFLDFALEEPRRFEAAFLTHSEKARRYPDDFVAGQSPAGNLQLKMIETAMDDGVLSRTSPVEILVTIAGLSQGLVTLYRAGRIAGGEEEFRALYRRAMPRCIDLPQGEIAMIAIVCTLLSGVGFYFSLMLGDQWWLAWLAPIPVLWLAYGDSKGWIAFAASFAAMVLGNLNALPAYGAVMPPMVIGLILAGPSLIFAAAAMLSRRVARTLSPLAGVLAFAALWTTFDYLVGFAHDGAIASPANSQVLMPLMIQSASLFGPFAITFLLGFFAAGIAMTLATRRIAPAAIAVALLAANVAFGTWRLNEPQGAIVRVGIGVDDAHVNARSEAMADSLVSDYAAAARKLAAQGATFIVFPEKVAVLKPAWRDGVLQTMQRAADETHATIVMGFHEDGGAMLNAAHVFVPGQTPKTYIKRHFVTGLEEGYTPGKGPFVLPDKTGVDICKDMDYPGMLRADSRITHVTLLAAPAWDFDKDRIYHARPALLRGVEEGFALARSAKQGLLTLTDANGRMIAMKRSEDAGMVTLVGDLPRGSGVTLYQSIGDVFAWLCLVLGVGLVGFSIFRSRVSAP